MRLQLSAALITEVTVVCARSHYASSTERRSQQPDTEINCLFEICGGFVAAMVVEAKHSQSYGNQSSIIFATQGETGTCYSALCTTTKH